MDPNRTEIADSNITLPRSVLEGTLDLWSQASERHFFPIVGGSMFPLLQEGDQVLVAHGAANARRGDIILFRQAETTIAHRLLHIRKSADAILFIAKGDNVPHADPPVSASAVIGRVVAIRRANRLMSLETPRQRIFGAVIANLAIISEQVDNKSHRLKQRCLGSQPNRATAFLRRSAQALLARVLRIARTLASRDA